MEIALFNCPNCRLTSTNPTIMEDPEGKIRAQNWAEKYSLWQAEDDKFKSEWNAAKKKLGQLKESNAPREQIESMEETFERVGDLYFRHFPPLGAPPRPAFYIPCPHCGHKHYFKMGKIDG